MELPLAMDPTEPDADQLRMLEALLFAATAPMSERDIASRLPDGADIASLLAALQARYAGHGINLVHRGQAWLFQTAPDLAFLLRREVDEPRKLSRPAVETLAIIAYHQPVSRAEIEDIRGVSISKGTLDILIEAGWVRPMGRREVPGRPVTYGTTPDFLVHFGLEALNQLPGLEELKAAGLLDPFDPALVLTAGAEQDEGDETEDGQHDLPLPDQDEADAADS